MSGSSTDSTAQGAGSVPRPRIFQVDFTDTSASRLVDGGQERLHAVVGGDGPPLLLVHGYDTSTLAGDLIGLMDALGHQRFALFGTDTGCALAADHPDRVERLIVAEAPLTGRDALTSPGRRRQVLRRPARSRS